MLPQGYAIRVASPLLMVLVMLAVASAFATWRAHAGTSQAPRGAARAMVRSVGSGPPSAASTPATPEYSGSDGSLFSNDADDEEVGTDYAFVVISIVAVWLLLFGESGLLLALCGGPAKLFSMHALASERPG
jgi:hypothetical protein